MANLGRATLFVASATITTATFAVRKIALAPVTAGPSAAAPILPLLAVAASALALVALRPAVATVAIVPLPLGLSCRRICSRRRRTFGRGGCSRSVGGSCLSRLRGALVCAGTPVLLASIAARAAVLFPLVPMPARPPDFLELLVFSLGRSSCRFRRSVRCAAGLGHLLFAAHRRRCGFRCCVHGRLGGNHVC